VELERKLAADTLTSDERKHRQLLSLGKKESTFLRLRRTKLGLDDFRTVKVIGKGAFGEVRDTWTIPQVRCCMLTKCAWVCALGEARTEDRYGADICHEDTYEKRDVKEGAGESFSSSAVCFHVC
jgi:hypothetical protein